MRTHLSSQSNSPLAMKMALAAIAIVVFGSLTLAWRQASAADEYTFLIRGDVVEVDTAHKTIKINSRHTSTAGENELGGQTVEFSVSKAVYYKYNNKLVKVRATLGAFNVGDEVVARGAKKSGGNFNISTLVLNYHKVNLRGTLQGHNVADGILEIDIDKMVRPADGKDYRIKTFPKGQRVKVYYDKDSTKFISRDGREMNTDEVANNNERITVEGIDVRFGSRLIAGPDAKVTDGRFKF